MNKGSTVDNGNELDAFRLPVDSLPMRRKERNSRQPVARQQGAFIRGPISLAWLEGVLSLPGRGPLVMALALMYQSGLEGSARVRFTHKLMGRFGVAPRSASRILELMQAAGLVRIHRPPGRCREVEIVTD